MTCSACCAAPAAQQELCVALRAKSYAIAVDIHLNETPAESEDSVVTTVRYQVLDIKAMNAFLQKHRQHWTLKADSKLIETME